MWSSLNEMKGLQYWFDPVKKSYDFDSKKLINNLNTEIINRGSTQLFYDPSGETSFRRQYKIIVDVWNLNDFWQSMIVIIIILCSISFYFAYRDTNKQFIELNLKQQMK